MIAGSADMKCIENTLTRSFGLNPNDPKRAHAYWWMAGVIDRQFADPLTWELTERFAEAILLRGELVWREIDEVIDDLIASRLAKGRPLGWLKRYVLSEYRATPPNRTGVRRNSRARQDAALRSDGPNLYRSLVIICRLFRQHAHAD
jgi:hypothetical protein